MQVDAVGHTARHLATATGGCGLGGLLLDALSQLVNALPRLVTFDRHTSPEHAEKRAENPRTAQFQLVSDGSDEWQVEEIAQGKTSSILVVRFS